MDNHFASVAVTGHELVLWVVVSATAHAALLCHGLLQRAISEILADSGVNLVYQPRAQNTVGMGNFILLPRRCY